jgi:hypothetical protein
MLFKRKTAPKKLREFTHWVGGYNDGQTTLGHCSAAEQRVDRACRKIVFAVYKEDSDGSEGKLVFQGYKVIG